MRVAVVAGTYPLDKMGGSERQALLISEGLAELGHEVVFVATNSDVEEEFAAGDLTVTKIPRHREVGRDLHGRLVTRVIREKSPDVCYVRRFTELATLSAICRNGGVPVVSMSCHLNETSPILLGYHASETLAHILSLKAIAHLRSFAAIRFSAAHVCNTEFLRRQTQRWFPRMRIRMIYNGSPVLPLPHPVGRVSPGQVIWVNNLKRWKRPEVFVRLAAALPQFRFVMIGRMPGNKRYASQLRRSLQQATANLQYLGPLPIDQVNELIKQSALLLYTSRPVEGFGNSFLQAWGYGVPTVSLSFDLDGILDREGIGRCSQTFDQLRADVEELMTDGVVRRDMGCRARDYVIRHHSAAQMVAQYEMLFNEVRAVGTSKWDAKV
jgi:glycosyltransferase involved in cell wall biosynthesis